MGKWRTPLLFFFTFVLDIFPKNAPGNARKYLCSNRLGRFGKEISHFYLKKIRQGHLTKPPPIWYNTPMKTTTVYPKSIKLPTEFDTLKKGSSNKKLGFKVTAKKWTGKRLYSLTLTERDTCPTSCHHWEDCYGNNMPFAHRFSIEGLTDKLEIEIAALMKETPTRYCYSVACSR